MFSKYPKVMNRMVDLIQSPEISVCRNATYALATAAQNGRFFAFNPLHNILSYRRQCY
jgi:hypothetical protein